MYTLVNRCVATIAVFAGGVFFAIILFLAPILFVIGIVALFLRLFFGFRAWRKLPIQDQKEYMHPGHFMTYNHALSPITEWGIALMGFVGTVCWIKF